MFSLNESNRFLVCLQGVDLRKGVNSLCGLVHSLSFTPHNGDVYVFINKNRTTLKLLRWERGGYVIYYKRLEKGRISHKVFTGTEPGFRPLRWDELVLLIEGLNPKTRRRKRYNFE